MFILSTAFQKNMNVSFFQTCAAYLDKNVKFALMQQSNVYYLIIKIFYNFCSSKRMLKVRPTLMKEGNLWSSKVIF